MNTLVQLDGVSKRYGKNVLAVDGVDLSIAEGEFVTLLGPSGCGKTTLLRMLAGFETPDHGTIRLAGDDVTHLPPYKRNVNMVFQDYALFPHLTVRKNVAFGLERMGAAKDVIRKKVDDALELVDLSDKSEGRPHELSGGQRQRVALARALVREPKVLLLDEPLSALDANLREAMQVELKHLHQQIGLTFVMVTHDQTEALVMSDRTVVMHNGSIVQTGTPNELYDYPASTYVADFVGTSNLLTGVVSAASGTATEVSLGDVVLKCRPDQTVAKGQSVIVGFRPEKVKLLAGGAKTPKGWNAFEGHVDEALFHGNSVRLRCTLPGGQSILCDLQLGAEAVQSGCPEAGTTVRMAINPDAMPIFTEDDR